MGFLEENLAKIEDSITQAAKKSNRNREDITLVGVTKTHEPSLINSAISLGITDIAENKVQEIMNKYEQVNPVNWHLIGHLQTNKVKYIIDKVKLIHSVDSIKLLDEIQRQASRHNIIMDTLIQVNIANDESKFGICASDIERYLEYVGDLSNVKIKGLMTILPKDNNSVSNRLHFGNINKLFIDIGSKKYDNVNMKYLSMGMSGDFKEAIEEGANIVRVGSALFGERNYKYGGV